MNKVFLSDRDHRYVVRPSFKVVLIRIFITAALIGVGLEAGEVPYVVIGCFLSINAIIYVAKYLNPQELIIGESQILFPGLIPGQSTRIYSHEIRGFSVITYKHSRTLKIILKNNKSHHLDLNLIQNSQDCLKNLESTMPLLQQEQVPKASGSRLVTIGLVAAGIVVGLTKEEFLEPKMAWMLAGCISGFVFLGYFRSRS